MIKSDKLRTRTLAGDVIFSGQTKKNDVKRTLSNALFLQKLKFIKRCIWCMETLNKQYRTHFTPFGEDPRFSSTLYCTENVTRRLGNSFEKVLNCDVKCSICENQSVGDKMVTWLTIIILNWRRKCGTVRDYQPTSHREYTSPDYKTNTETTAHLISTL